MVDFITLIELKSSAQQGCVWCQVVCRSINISGAEKFGTIKDVEIIARLHCPITIVVFSTEFELGLGIDLNCITGEKKNLLCRLSMRTTKPSVLFHPFWSRA